MKKNAVPYSIAAVFAVLFAVTAFTTIHWKKIAKNAEQEIAQLKTEKAQAELKIKQKKQDKVVPPPPPPPPSSNFDAGSGLGRDGMMGVAPDASAFIDNMKSRFEDMKNTDPERYNQIKQRMDDFMSKAQKEAADRIEYFKSLDIDTKSLTPEELENHNKLVEILEKNSKSLSYLAENPDAEDSTQVTAELFQSSMGVYQLLENERKIAIRSVGIKNGLEGEKLTSFEQDVGKAYDMTSMGFGRGGFGRRRR
ncbi:MAG TPA: hypothetical protein PK821_04680 [Victivallales bacterium]|nr:hypothetical protein [Victivallales bacterium]